MATKLKKGLILHANDLRKNSGISQSYRNAFLGVDDGKE